MERVCDVSGDDSGGSGTYGIAGNVLDISAVEEAEGRGADVDLELETGVRECCHFAVL
jgi:hypothetical protein